MAAIAPLLAPADGAARRLAEPPGDRRARVGALAAAVFVTAFAARLPLANAGLFHHDEVQLARAVERSWAEGRLFPAVKGRYGAVLAGVALYAPFHVATGGSAEPVVPLLGIASGALLVTALLLLAHELVRDRLAGALAAIIAGTGTLFLTSSSTGKENVPQLAIATLACWLLARAARRDAFGGRTVAMAVFSFALTVHEAGILLVPALAAFAAGAERAHGRPWNTVAVDLGLLAVATAGPVALSIWDEILRNALVVGPNSASFLGLLSPVLPDALRDLPPALGIAPLALAAVGLVRTAATRDRALLGIAPWLLVLLYFGNVSSYGARYLLYLLPPVAVLAAAGGAWLARVPARPPARAALAAALVAAAAVPGVARAWPLLAARARHSGPKAMALLVKARTEPDALVLCMDDSVFLEYYAGRRTLTHPVDDPAATAAFVHDLRRRVAAGERVYLGAYAFTYDRWGHLRGLVESAFTLVPVGQVVNEWYARPELEDVSFDDVLYRLEPR